MHKQPSLMVWHSSTNFIIIGIYILFCWCYNRCCRCCCCCWTPPRVAIFIISWYLASLSHIEMARQRHRSTNLDFLRVCVDVVDRAKWLFSKICTVFAVVDGIAHTFWINAVTTTTTIIIWYSWDITIRSTRSIWSTPSMVLCLLCYARINIYIIPILALEKEHAKAKCTSRI